MKMMKIFTVLRHSEKMNEKTLNFRKYIFSYFSTLVKYVYIFSLLITKFVFTLIKNVYNGRVQVVSRSTVV